MDQNAIGLIERHAQLATLAELVAQARNGRGRLVALTGEAGAGKTAVARAFTEQLSIPTQDSGRVLWSACEDLTTPAPLGPLYDLARGCDWSLDQALESAGSRLALFSEALGRFDQPGMATLVVIEDVHWADEATLDFIRFLSRRIRTARVVLLVTARRHDPRAQSALARTLGEAPPDDVVRIDAPPLSEAAVHRLAEAEGRDGAALFAATAGNAFFVSEVLRAQEPDGVPATVRHAVLARAARLPRRGREALEIASIFPRRVEISLLAAIGGVEAEPGAEDCVDAEMLSREADCYAFRHEIARRAIEATLPRARRRALNGLALSALAQAPVRSTARLAHHAREAGDSDAILAHAPRAAAEAARVGAHREAALHYESALAHASHLSQQEQIDLQEASAFEHHLIGDLPAAIRAQSAALALHRQRGDELQAGDSLRWLSRLHWLAGDRGSADRFASEAVQQLAALPPGRELAMAQSNSAQLAMLAGDALNAERWGRAAVALAEQLGEPAILAHALNNLGTAKQWRDPTAARAELTRSLTLALKIDAQDHAARAYTNAACLEADLRDGRRARPILETGIAYCVERDLNVWRDYMRGWLAELNMREGRWDDAATLADRVLSRAASTPLVRNPSVLALARLRMRRGDPAVEPLLSELETFLQNMPEPARLTPFAALKAEQAWLAGANAAATLDLLARTLAIAAQTESHWLYGETAFWLVRLAPDRPEIARDRVAEPYRLMLSGDWQAAAAAWAGIGAPYERALALMEGDDPALLEAFDIFTGLGAGPAAALVRARMQQRGLRLTARGPRESTRANAAGLTRRQMDVLTHLERGLTNAEIGNALYVSPKTVDHHVSAILAKLGATSRGEAVAMARRLGLYANDAGRD